MNIGTDTSLTAQEGYMSDMYAYKHVLYTGETTVSGEVTRMRYF
jgi:hypothetical protein